MKTENIAPTIKTNLDTKSEKYLQNKKMMHEKIIKKTKEHNPLTPSIKLLPFATATIEKQ